MSDSGGELHDLAGEINARAYYAMEAFKGQVAAAVRCGQSLAEARRQMAGDDWPGWLAENVPFDGDVVDVFVDASERFGDHDGYPEERWRELSELHLEAVCQWMDLADGKRRPAKRWRTRQLLKKNPMAGIALVTVRELFK